MLLLSGVLLLLCQHACAAAAAGLLYPGRVEESNCMHGCAVVICFKQAGRQRSVNTVRSPWVLLTLDALSACAAHKHVQRTWLPVGHLPPCDLKRRNAQVSKAKTWGFQSLLCYSCTAAPC
jgi:hypothetical protein